MPQPKTPRRGGARSSAKAKRGASRNGRGDPANVQLPDLAPRLPAEGDEQALINSDQQLTNLRDAAQVLRGAHNYEGRLTPALLLALEPLLYAPIPERFIETVEANSRETRSGEPWPPFDMTGIRGAGAQVQADRMNAVLGLAHWRYLTYHGESGTLCKIVVVVGNDLACCALSVGPDPHLLITGGGDGSATDPFQHADVLAAREGWGGFARGRLGDAYKGAETNCLKRLLARFGPGAEVYRLESDEDPRIGAERPETPGQSAAVPAPAPDAEAEPDWDTVLAELLVVPDDADDKARELVELRQKCATGMGHLAAPARQQVRELRTHATKRALESLYGRINAALAAAGEEGAPDSA